MAWPPPNLPTNRSNTTDQFDTHAPDHNAVNEAMNDTTAEITANNAVFARGGPGPTSVFAGTNGYQVSTATIPVLLNELASKYGDTGEVPSSSFQRSGSIPSSAEDLINLPTNGAWTQIGDNLTLAGANGKTGQRYLVIAQVHCINNQGSNPAPVNFPADGNDCRVEVSFSYDSSQSQPEIGSQDHVRAPMARFQSRMWPWDECTISGVYGLALSSGQSFNPVFKLYARNSVWAGGSAVAQIALRGCSFQVLELGRSG